MQVQLNGFLPANLSISMPPRSTIAVPIGVVERHKVQPALELKQKKEAYAKKAVEIRKQIEEKKLAVEEKELAVQEKIRLEDQNKKQLLLGAGALAVAFMVIKKNKNKKRK